MKQLFLFAMLFSSAVVLPMEQIHQYCIEPLSICGAAVLPGASYIRSRVIGDNKKFHKKPALVYRVVSSYAGGLAAKQSTLVLMNAALGIVGATHWLRPVSYVPSPIDLMLDGAKSSDHFESMVVSLAKEPEYEPIVKLALGSLVSYSVNRLLVPKIVEYMPTLGQLLEQWQKVHAPYSPNILDKSWAKIIVGAYASYAAVLTADYYCRSFLGKRPKV